MLTVPKAAFFTFAIIALPVSAFAQSGSAEAIYNDGKARCRQIQNAAIASKCVADVEAAYARAKGAPQPSRSPSVSNQTKARQQEADRAAAARAEESERRKAAQQQAMQDRANARVEAQRQALAEQSARKKQEQAEALRKAREAASLQDNRAKPKIRFCRSGKCPD